MTNAPIRRAKFTVKLTHQAMTRFRLDAISNSEDRPSGRAFFAFTFLAFASFLGAGVAFFATAFAAFATGFALALPS
jgi:hypothetical protein